MKCTGILKEPSIDFTTGKMIIAVQVNEDVREHIQKYMDKPKLDIEIKVYRERRSLDANNYFWQLLSKMAPILHTNKDSLYLVMLEKYGAFMYLPGNDDDYERLKTVFRIVNIRGETVLTTPSGKELHLHQLQCYKGSSMYDTLEMSHLIDGVVSEAKELGIDTRTSDEIERMKQQWHINV